MCKFINRIVKNNRERHRIRNWINDNFDTELKEDELTSIKDFSLIWNIFENRVCENHCSVNTLTVKLSEIDFNLNCFNGSLEYFKNRYTSNGTTNDLYDSLSFRANDNKQLVTAVLLGQENGTNEIILALSIIIYRLRNNLFHGLKQIETINEQRRNFEVANKVLKEILVHFLNKS